ncbi:MAG TPA: lytic transglycosylase domain-containing protein [Pseudobdellovibrionaceae bacterium]|nr:lytic transglycosylase domain-containing protein [Pseudobdellovibrionaceae bacterium]
MSWLRHLNLKLLRQARVALAFVVIAASLMTLWVRHAEHKSALEVAAGVMDAEPSIKGTQLARLPQIPTAAFVPEFDPRVVLEDRENRIRDEFKVENISPGLEERVEFWLKIYSLYDSNKKVIHHADFPWVIYKVVDVEPIVNASHPKRRWQRNQVADRVVSGEAKLVREALKLIALRGENAKSDDPDLQRELPQVIESLKALPGDLRRQAQRAAREVRVQTGQRDFFAEGLARGPRYWPTMEEIFAKHRLPLELTRLPLVESSFNKEAHSKVGAVGVWQFMENTGRKFLTVNSVVDERKSVFKSTEAAARLMKENYMILGRSWPFALTAWNHGPGGVRKASQAARSKDFATVIERYQSRRFDFASTNFFPCFLAALYAERYSDRLFPDVIRMEQALVKPVKVPRPTLVTEIIKVAGLSMEEFISINPEFEKIALRKGKLPRGYVIHVPSDARSAVEAYMYDQGSERLTAAND